MTYSRDQVLRILEHVRDPEIPVVSVVELGIVREIEISGEHVVVKITPTYSGCPAMRVIEQNVLDTLRDKGVKSAAVETVYSPAWTTDWITEDGKRKLKEYGIAPPGKADDGLVSLRKKAPPINCPFCNSANTRLTSQFGPTACKSLYYCDGCHQPFEHFKPF